MARFLLHRRFCRLAGGEGLSISFDVYIDSVEGNRVTKIEGIGATSAPVNNEWFTVTAQVSALRGKCIQFNHEAANRLFFYIDNMAFNKS